MNEIDNIVENPVVASPSIKNKPGRKPQQVQATPSAIKVITEMPVFIDPVEAKKRDLKEKIIKDRTHKAQNVTGKFLFNECPGGELIFYFREFPGDQIVKYSMKHDTIHTIPLGVAQHLNDRCAYPEFSHNLDNGKSINGENMYVQSKVHRTNFIPLDFTLNVGNTSGKSIAQVTYQNPVDTNGR